MIVWLIGLAGAGKTSVAQRLVQRMRAENPATVLIDGDAVREILGQDLGHSLEDRRRNGWRIARLCHFLDRQNISVVCAILSLFEEHQEWNRRTFSRYFEVYIDVPMSVLEKRDQKGLYSGAKAGLIKDVVGIDIPFHPPARADLIVRNDGTEGDLDAIAARIAAATGKSQ